VCQLNIRTDVSVRLLAALVLSCDYNIQYFCTKQSLGFGLSSGFATSFIVAVFSLTERLEEKSFRTFSEFLTRTLPTFLRVE
jgi:hypothetical protein